MKSFNQPLIYMVSMLAAIISLLVLVSSLQIHEGSIHHQSLSRDGGHICRLFNIYCRVCVKREFWGAHVVERLSCLREEEKTFLLENRMICKCGSVQSTAAGEEDRWCWAVMSKDECDFEVGDVGNRGPTRLAWWPGVSEIIWRFLCQTSPRTGEAH